MDDPQSQASSEQKTSAKVEQNLEAWVAMHVSAEQAVTRPQKAIERLVSVVALPATLVGVLLVVGTWVGVNLAVQSMGRKPLDAPPFAWLQTFLSLTSLAVAMIVVITQNRQGKVADLHARLDLQVNLLVDQKASKIIQLLEEMRLDSPALKNRQDDEAEDLQETVDPANLVAMISDKLSTALSSAIDEAVDNPSPPNGEDVETND